MASCIAFEALDSTEGQKKVKSSPSVEGVVNAIKMRDHPRYKRALEKSEH